MLTFREIFTNFRRPATALLVATTLGQGCSAEAESGPSVDELAEHLAEVQCARRSSLNCEQEPWADPTTCVAEQATTLRDLYAQAEARGRIYDPSCAESLVSVDGTLDLLECHTLCQIFHGTKAEGEACEHEGPGTDCTGSLACVDGVCRSTSESFVDEGEACSTAIGEPLCGFGLLCDRNDSGTCQPGPAEGEPCVKDIAGDPTHCGLGFFCEFEQGTCQRQIELGQPCPTGAYSNAASCKSFNCEEGVCAPSPLECMAPSNSLIGCK
ncbi:MAG: hypothetical protein AAGF11_14710 [Myxococcota bacterium]